MEDLKENNYYIFRRVDGISSRNSLVKGRVIEVTKLTYLIKFQFEETPVRIYKSAGDLGVVEDLGQC